MAVLVINDLDDGAASRLAEQAARQGRSLEELARTVLEGYSTEPTESDRRKAAFDEFWRRADARRNELAQSGREFSDSAELLREDRDR